MLGLSLYLLTTTLLTCGAQEYYVTPTPPPNPNCPSNEFCDTLGYYAKNASALIKGRRNVSLLFMNGYHFSETILEISNVDSFTIAGLDPNFDIEISSTTIGLTQIFITNGTIFTLKSIAIIDSSLNVSNFQSMINYEMRCQNSILSLRATQVDSVLLTKSILFGCSWLLYWGYTDETGYYDPIETAAIGISSTNANIEPTIEISDTEILTESVIFMRLARNGTSSIRLNVSFCMFLETIGLVVTVHTVGQSLPESNLEFTMEHCVMTDNLYGTIIYANTTHNVYVDISDCHFTANANGSKSIEISAIESNINATVKDNVFLGGFCIVNYVVGPAGMLALSVSRCNFSEANLDSIRADMDEGMLDALFEDCRFVDGFNSKSELILQDRVIVARANTPQSSIVLRNSIIMNNHFLTGILVTLGPIHMTIDNCTIKDNSAIISGGLLAVNSNVTLMGDTIFENNTGSTGAAIYLLRSYLILTQDINLAFINNKAELTGGAIFVSDTSNNFGNEIVRVSIDPNPKCFYQLSQDVINSSISKPFVTFVNNTAVLAGNNIYGGALKDACTVTPSLLTQSFEVQDTVFDFQSLSRSSVSSSPRRVCVCENGEPKCTDMEHIYIKKSITSGEIISIDVMLVGYDFGTTIGGVFATELHTAAENGAAVNSLGKGEEIQHLDTKKFCTTVNYSVRGKTSTTARFILTSNNLNAETIMSLIDLEFTKESIKQSIQEFDQFGVIRTSLLYTPIFISIDILPCPMGLEMDITGVCNCITELVTRGITRKCTVENGKTMITRNERNWLRIHNDSYHGLVFEYARRCLYAYCNSIAVDIDPSDPDSQCAFNHSGVLCGGCQEGLSLAIGSARCMDCHDNSHLALILVFIPLGLVLVLLIWILDLTITRGTINGLLFYANVVGINGEIFFVENTGLDDTLNRCLQVAKLFIDWCNLDFGIESCFIYRLNAMGKIWLQFLFPLYVWTLAGLIIVVCKYSTRLTKLFGSHSVSVLITLFLVAYMKLVQIIIAVFAYADIVDLNGGLIHKVWLVDGNVDYDDLTHIILCLLSGILAIFLFAITIWLILIRCTLKVPKHHKIDPILDSFTGRLKKNYEFWIGLSLISRVFLALVTILAHREVVLRILIVVIFILGFIVSNAYKRIYLSLLEVAFLLNLLAVSAVFVGEIDNRIRAISISVSVLISALMFLGICIYHGINFVKRVRPKVVKYLKKRLEMKQKHKEAEDEQEEVPKTPTITVVNINSDIELSTEMESSTKKPRMVADYSIYREELLDSTAL